MALERYFAYLFGCLAWSQAARQPRNPQSSEPLLLASSRIAARPRGCLGHRILLEEGVSGSGRKDSLGYVHLR